jgi:hypothetical protein
MPAAINGHTGGLESPPDGVGQLGAHRSEVLGGKPLWSGPDEPAARALAGSDH